MATYRTATGDRRLKQVPVSIQDEVEAKRWAEAWVEQSLVAGVHLANQQVSLPVVIPTIRSIVDRWHAYKLSLPGSSEKQCNESRAGILRHGGALLDRNLEAEVCTSVPTVAAWVDGLKRSKLAPNSVRNIVQSFRGLVVDARGNGWIHARENAFLDPFIKAKLKVPRNDVIVVLSEWQALQLLSCESQHVPQQRRILNAVALCTGMRKAELEGLAWDSIDFKASTGRVFRQFQEGSFKAPKKGSRRVLPLHPRALASLRSWHRASGKPTGDTPVFPGIGGRWSSAPAARKFREDLVASGIPATFDAGDHTIPFTLHCLRRTFMSLLEAHGVPRHLIGNLAGHGASSTADRHYLSKNLEVFRKAILKLPF